MHGRAALTEAEFEQSLRGEEETSSISASESDSESEETPVPQHRSPELLFTSGKLTSLCASVSAPLLRRSCVCHHLGDIRHYFDGSLHVTAKRWGIRATCERP